MINENKWINSLPKTNLREEKNSELDFQKWVNTIPRKKSYSSIKKYALLTTLFVSGLLLVPVVKNETRNLQKEINNLEASINVIKFNLNQAILDNEVITSPENISILAEEYLNNDLVFYKRNQIKNFGDETKEITEVGKIQKDGISKQNKKNSESYLKSQIVKKIEQKKLEIQKLQKLYSSPKSIPGEIKTQLGRQIEEKKTDLKNIYKDPERNVDLGKVGRWTVVQVVKAFLGMPIIPGR